MKSRKFGNLIHVEYRKSDNDSTLLHAIVEREKLVRAEIDHRIVKYSFKDENGKKCLKPDGTLKVENIFVVDGEIEFIPVRYLANIGTDDLTIVYAYARLSQIKYLKCPEAYITLYEREIKYPEIGASFLKYHDSGVCIKMDKLDGHINGEWISIETYIDKLINPTSTDEKIEKSEIVDDVNKREPKLNIESPLLSLYAGNEDMAYEQIYVSKKELETEFNDALESETQYIKVPAYLFDGVCIGSATIKIGDNNEVISVRLTKKTELNPTCEMTKVWYTSNGYTNELHACDDIERYVKTSDLDKIFNGSQLKDDAMKEVIPVFDSPTSKEPIGESSISNMLIDVNYTGKNIVNFLNEISNKEE